MSNIVQADGSVLKRTVADSNKRGGNPVYDLPLRKGHTIEHVKVTPDIAQHWLTFNVANRDIVTARVDQFRADMERGDWKYQGDPIRFAQGKLLDGQHRLHAMVLAGCSLHMLVVCGLDAETQSNMDTGRGRSARDILSIEGVESWGSRTLGGALHLIINHEKGTGIYSPNKHLNRDIRNYYLEHRAALESSLQAVKGFPRRNPVIPHSRLLALHYVLSKIDAAQAAVFFERLTTGDGVSKTSAVYHLRQRLLSDLLEKKSRSSYDQCAFVIKAWNKVRRNTPTNSQSFLHLRGDEAFPEIQ